MFVHRSRRLPLRVLEAVTGIRAQRLRRLRDGRGTIRPEERANLAKQFRVEEAVIDQAIRDCVVWKLQRDAQSEWNGVPSDWNRLRSLAIDDSLIPPSPVTLLLMLRQRDAARSLSRSERLKGPMIAILQTIADGSYAAVFGGTATVSDRDREDAADLLKSIEVRRVMATEGRRYPTEDEIPPERVFFEFFHLFSNGRHVQSAGCRSRRPNRPSEYETKLRFGWLDDPSSAERAVARLE